MAVPVTVREKVDFHKDVYKTLIKGLMHQKNTGELCDVKLRLNGRDYFAHRAVLSANSAYFKSMFTSQMREQTSFEIDITQSMQVDNDNAFKQILDFMYCGDLEISVENAEDLLRIADFLLLEDIKEYCRQFYLQNGNLNLSNCVSLSFMADHHNLFEVAQVSRNMVKARFHDYLVYSDYMLDLPASCLLKLLRDKEVTKFASGDSLAHLVIRWVRHIRPERESFLMELLSCVQLQTLSQDVIKLLLHEDEVNGDSVMVARLKSLQSPSGDGACSRIPSDSTTTCLSNYGELDNEAQVFESEPSIPVVIAANCHPGFHFVKFLIYNSIERTWHNLSINSESFLHDLPPRLGVVSMTMEAHTLFCLLGHNLPYPSNMLRIHIMALDLHSGQHEMITFRHTTNQSECCQTSLTDDRSIPPVIAYCHGFLCIVGNKEGTGNVFLCDLANQTYNCYQVHCICL